MKCVEVNAKSLRLPKHNYHFSRKLFSSCSNCWSSTLPCGIRGTSQPGRCRIAPPPRTSATHEGSRATSGRLKGGIISNAVVKMKKTETLVPLVHPGEVLREDFMKPLGLTVTSWHWSCPCRPRVLQRSCMNGGGLPTK